MAERCVDTRPRHLGGAAWVCDGEWHRGWDGHDPYCQRCPKAHRTVVVPPLTPDQRAYVEERLKREPVDMAVVIGGPRKQNAT